MRCIVPGPNARVLAKAIQSFARIGNELFIEAQEDGLSIRAVNSTKSAFAMMMFNPSFFIEYNINPADDENENKCKISVKSCLNVFKNMKQVEECKITLDSSSYKLIFQLKCRLETIKTHHVSILENESLQAVYMTDKAPNKLTASHKLFADIVSNFQTNEEEITMEALSKEITVKNYVEGSHVDKRYMRSQLALQPNEFDSYKILEETSITFCLRELRAILNLADALNLEMSVNFETAGKPVVFVLRNFETFEANLVMSTLAPDADNDCNNETVMSANTNISKTKPPEKKRKLLNNNINEITLDNSYTNSKRNRSPPPTNKKNNKKDNENSELIFNFGSKSESLDILKERNIEQRKEETVKTISIPGSSHHAVSSNIPQSVPSIESEEICVIFQDESPNIMSDLVGIEPMHIPASPTAIKKKRIKHVFKRCFEATFDPINFAGMNQVLAENSDPEDMR